jgi:uncharacterized protein with HEPN domain
MDRDELYLRHIVEAVRKIRQYTEGFTLESFRGNTLVQDGVVRQLEIIGEASRMVSETTRKAHPHIPWFEIAGMRNRLIHEYFGVDLAVVWKTVTEDLEILVEEFDANA